MLMQGRQAVESKAVDPGVLTPGCQRLGQCVDKALLEESSHADAETGLRRGLAAAAKGSGHARS